MGTIRLPRVSIATAIAGNFTPTLAFAKWWDQTASAIETTFDNILDTQATLLAVQGQQASLLAALTASNLQVAQVSMQANANTPSGSPQELSQTVFMDITSSSWTPGPTVSFPAAVSVTHLTFETSGPALTGGTTAVDDFTGEVRIVQIVSGVETTVETESFSVLRHDPPDPNDVEFAGFTHDAAETTTGVVGYRLDARSTGAGTFTGISVLLQVWRAP